LKKEIDMAKKHSIQTALLNSKVIIHNPSEYGPGVFIAGQFAVIKNVYYDDFGDLKYTLVVTTGDQKGKVYDTYSNNFEIVLE
jgi:hypothetical protein